jgi:hypothetical protein
MTTATTTTTTTTRSGDWERWRRGDTRGALLLAGLEAGTSLKSLAHPGTTLSLYSAHHETPISLMDAPLFHAHLA